MYNYIIVDDEPLIREGTLKKLEPLSDRVTCVGEADNGRQAIQLIEELHPCLVILDMEMPVMDGTQLLTWLSENYPSLQLIVISGYKNFDYIKHAISAKVIDYILKPFTDEQIQKTVLEAISRLQESESIDAKIRLSEEQKEMAYYEHDVQLLQNLILGYAVAETALNSQRLSFIRQSRHIFLAVVYSASQPDDFHPQQHLSELGFSDFSLYLSHPTNAQLAFFILCPPQDTALSAQTFCTEFAHELISYFNACNAVTFWGLSSSCPSPEQLHAAYEQACAALNSMPVTESRSCCYSWTPSVMTEIREITWPKKDEFLFRLEAGMTAEVYRLLLELQEYYSSVGGLSLTDIKYHYHQLTDECLLILKQYLHQGSQSQSMQNIVREMFSPDELHRYYKRFFGNLSEMLRPQSIYAVDDTIERMKIYTQRNYQKNLTVEFLSSLFYMNSSYLSHLFRKQTGQKYAQYLNSIRIEKAKELLVSSDRKLYQISKAVGYDNSKYFFRVFKKWVGMTPEQYRASLSNLSRD